MATVASRERRAGTPGPRPGRRPRRGWWTALLALLIVAAAAGAALGAAQLVEQRRGARAEVVYDVGDVASQPQADRLLATQVVVLGSRAVLGPVAEAHGLEARELSRQVEAELLADSQVIEVTVAAPDAARALALVEDVVASYLEVSMSEASPARVDEQAGRLAAELDDLAARRAALEAEIAALRDDGPPEEVSALTIELEAVSGRMQAWRDELVALELRAASGSDARVLTPPYALDEPLGPGPLQATAAGTIVGIFLAAATALGLRRLGRERP